MIRKSLSIQAHDAHDVEMAVVVLQKSQAEVRRSGDLHVLPD
jgi:hypothetical protein